MWSWASARGQGARGPRVSAVPKGRESSPLPAFPPPEQQGQKEEEGGEVRAPGSQSRVTRGPRKQAFLQSVQLPGDGSGVTLVWTGRGVGGGGLSVGGRSRQPEGARSSRLHLTTWDPLARQRGTRSGAAGGAERAQLAAPATETTLLSVLRGLARRCP